MAGDHIEWGWFGRMLDERTQACGTISHLPHYGIRSKSVLHVGLNLGISTISRPSPPKQSMQLPLSPLEMATVSVIKSTYEVDYQMSFRCVKPKSWLLTKLTRHKCQADYIGHRQINQVGRVAGYELEYCEGDIDPERCKASST